VVWMADTVFRDFEEARSPNLRHLIQFSTAKSNQGSKSKID